MHSFTNLGEVVHGALQCTTSFFRSLKMFKDHLHDNCDTVVYILAINHQVDQLLAGCIPSVQSFTTPLVKAFDDSRTVERTVPGTLRLDMFLTLNIIRLHLLEHVVIPLPLVMITMKIPNNLRAAQADSSLSTSVERSFDL